MPVLKPPIGVRSERDGRGRRTYTERKYAGGAVALFYGLPLMVGSVCAWHDEAADFGPSRPVLLGMLAAGAALIYYGLVLLARCHRISFDPERRTVISRVSGLTGVKERLLRYDHVRLLVLRCAVWGFPVAWHMESKRWAVALELPDAEIVLALHKRFELVRRAAEELSKEVDLPWSRSDIKLSRFLF